jgi:hypothetical protein
MAPARAGTGVRLRRAHEAGINIAAARDAAATARRRRAAFTATA